METVYIEQLDESWDMEFSKIRWKTNHDQILASILPPRVNKHRCFSLLWARVYPLMVLRGVEGGGSPDAYCYLHPCFSLVGHSLWWSFRLTDTFHLQHVFVPFVTLSENRFAWRLPFIYSDVLVLLVTYFLWCSVWRWLFIYSSVLVLLVTFSDDVFDVYFLFTATFQFCWSCLKC